MHYRYLIKNLVFFLIIALELNSQSQQLYFGTNSVAGIYVTNSDNSSSTNLIQDIRPRDITMDPFTDQIFWIDRQSKKLMTKGESKYHYYSLTAELKDLRSLDLDAREQKLYFSQEGNIWSCNYDGGDRVKIYSSFFEDVIGLCVDTVNREIYFFETGVGLKKIDYDGSNEQTLRRGFERYITVLHNGYDGYLYMYEDGYNDENSIVYSMRSDGAELKQIHNQRMNDIYYHSSSKTFYFSAWGSIEHDLYSLDLSGNVQVVGDHDNDFGLYSIAYDHGNGRPIFSCYSFSNRVMSYGDESDTYEQILVAPVFNIEDLVFDSLNQRLLWINTFSGGKGDSSVGIWFLNSDLELDRIKLPRYAGINPTGLFIDYPKSRYFWASNNTRNIYSCDYNGEQLDSIVVSDAKWFTDLVFVPEQDMISWITGGVKGVYTTNYQADTIIKVGEPSYFQFPVKLTVNKKNGDIYWSDREQIRRMSKDGIEYKVFTRLSTVFDGADDFVIDYSEDYLYMAVNGSNDGLYRVHLDSSDVEYYYKDPDFSLSMYTLDLGVSGQILNDEYWLKVDSEVRLFPNPSPGNFNVHSSTPISEINIYDLEGRLHHSVNFEAQGDQAEFFIRKNGLYTVVVKTENGVAVQKVTVCH